MRVATPNFRITNISTEWLCVFIGIAAAFFSRSEQRAHFFAEDFAGDGDGDA